MFIAIWTSFVVCTTVGLTCAGHIVPIGHSLEPDLQRPLPYRNATFLLGSVNFQDAILFAFSAHFLCRDPIRFQVWRPVAILQGRFRLVWEMLVQPPRTGRVDIYIKETRGGKCVPVHGGDRLGVSAHGPSMSLGYKFVTSGPAVVTHPLRSRNGHFAVNDTVTFDSLTFPYEYSVVAYIDTAIDRYVGKDQLLCPDATIKDAVNACPMKYVYMDQKDPRSMTGSMGHDPPAYNERCANIDAAILPNYQEATYK